MDLQFLKDLNTYWVQDKKYGVCIGSINFFDWRFKGKKSAEELVASLRGTLKHIFEYDAFLDESKLKNCDRISCFKKPDNMDINDIIKSLITLCEQEKIILIY